MHEWLSGGVSPCQGEGRGFESRLVLFSNEAENLKNKAFRYFFVSFGFDDSGYPAARSELYFIIC